MERVGPIPPPHAAQSIARLIPLGQGWVLEPLEAGFLLRTLAQEARPVQVRITGEEAQALRQGEVTPEQMAQRHGVALHHLPPAAVTVAFSDEAMRLSGRGGNKAQGGNSPLQQEQPPGQGTFLPRAGIIGAALIALLALALLWAV